MKASIQELAARRYSCRRYLGRPLEDDHRQAIQSSLETLGEGPLGNRCRFALVAAAPGDSQALKGLGTYGFIRGAAGFIVGAVQPDPHDMEDYGYCLERIVLEATDLDVDTCWLGGTFSRSSFASKISLREDEVIPAVVALGYGTETSPNHWIRRMAGSRKRLSPERLFFDGDVGRPLDLEKAGDLAKVLEVVRWAPSASNKQPWRLVRAGDEWHFFLERVSDPNKGVVHSIIKMEDVQRVDMGIAMCHFDLAAHELGYEGNWASEKAPTGTGPVEWQYTATWRPL